MKSLYRTNQGQAWDQVAREKYKSEKSMGVLLPANADEMDALLLAGETELEIPAMEIPAKRSLPPWERL